MTEALAAAPPVGAVTDDKRRSGWIILDKPLGLTSTQALSRVKRLFGVKKAGHVGTLDPLATGVLPIALGEATKTIPFLEDGEKRYRFSVGWGAETATDDLEGAVTARSDMRPASEQILSVLAQFTGVISQRPPIYSAIKIGGARAYDLARAGAISEIASRDVFVRELLFLGGEGADSAEFEVASGKGMYVRSLARDIGRALGTLAHVTALRRTAVSDFAISRAVTLDDLATPALLAGALLPIETVLSNFLRLEIDPAQASELRLGRAVTGSWKSSDGTEPAFAMLDADVIALGELSGRRFSPNRVFKPVG